MAGLSLATCDRALAPGGGAPEWVHLFPNGQMTGRDGRVFNLADPAAILLDFQSRGVDLPIDYEHQNDNPEAKAKGPVPAAGWIKELRSDETGLWGRVEWTATAREMIGKREYRYLSPSFMFHPQTRQVVRIKGAGLVHSPNLHLTALASEETETGKPSVASLISALAAALGLPPDADAEAVLSAIIASMGKPAKPAVASERADPTRFVPIDAVSELLADRNTQLATMREQAAQEMVSRAFREGHITPAMVGWAEALCRQDPSSFEAFLAKSPAPYAHLTRPVTQPPIMGRQSATSSEEEAICAQLGLKPGRLSN